MPTVIRNYALILLAAILAACNPMEQLADGEGAVAEFHQRLNASDFEAIWNDSHKDFKASGARDSALAFLAGVHERMGAVKSTSRQSFNINSNNGVTTVKVTQKTEFQRGSATETFEFVRNGERLQLWNYNINWGASGAAEAAE
uniref:hypothetical protein n=1 Tax=Parerythrobacter lutipelagi TaxID=1964208 RepID=UPI0010F7A7C8|nr:hypothetical protein [Parerythrobacter lutipelagi]